MVHLGRVLGVVGAVLIAVILGVVDTAGPRSEELTEPRWAASLAPLREAPIERHEVVVLSVPRSVNTEEAKMLLFEAAWQRPGVRWTTPGDRGTAAATAAVTVAGSTPPIGWAEVWRRGEIAVWRGSRP